jgi:hypothetical protein
MQCCVVFLPRRTSGFSHWCLVRSDRDRVLCHNSSCWAALVMRILNSSTPWCRGDMATAVLFGKRRRPDGVLECSFRSLVSRASDKARKASPRTWRTGMAKSAVSSNCCKMEPCEVRSRNCTSVLKASGELLRSKSEGSRVGSKTARGWSAGPRTAAHQAAA